MLFSGAGSIPKKDNKVAIARRAYIPIEVTNAP